MNTRAERTRYVLRDSDGYFITLKLEQKAEFMEGYRFRSEDEANTFLYGCHGPENPEDYRLVPIKVTFELEESK